MANKRQKKKQLKKDIIHEKLVRSGIEPNKIKKKSQIKKEYKLILAEQRKEEKRKLIEEKQKKQKKKEYNDRYRAKKRKERTEKRILMERITGVPMLEWQRGSLSKIDKLSLDQIRRGDFYIPEITGHGSAKDLPGFDFNKEYHVPDGQKLVIAFRALNGEINIYDELQRFDRYSDQDLIGYLRTIKNTPMTGTRGKKGSVGKNIGSSGAAGEAMISLGKQSAFDELYAAAYNENRRSNTFAKKINKRAAARGIGLQHSGIDYHWQYIRQKEGNRLKAYTKISAHKLLVIANAVMHNIRETDRSGFYQYFYEYAIDIILDMKHILEKP